MITISVCIGMSYIHVVRSETAHIPLIRSETALETDNLTIIASSTPSDGTVRISTIALSVCIGTIDLIFVCSMSYEVIAISAGICVPLIAILEVPCIIGTVDSYSFSTGMYYWYPILSIAILSLG